MNDKNRALLFGEDESEMITLTLTDENGKDFEAEVVASIEIEELGQEFVAVLPTEATEGFDENEALILQYEEDSSGDPVFSPVEDDETFDIVSQAFNQFFEGEAEILEEEDDEEESDSDDYLQDAVPGVSIQKD